MVLSLIGSLMSCKDGYELCEKVEEILMHYGISMCTEYGSYKDVQTLLCEVAEVMNREK